MGEPMTRLIFRRADLNDIDAIEKLVNSVYRGETGLRSWTTEAGFIGGSRVDRAGLRELIEKADSLVLLAYAEARPDDLLGTVHLERKGQEVYLGMLSVSVAAQNSGLGKALLEKSEELTRSFFKVHAVFMSVINIRTELIEWYERRGYRRTGETAPFPYGDPRFGEPLREDLFFVTLRKPL